MIDLRYTDLTKEELVNNSEVLKQLFKSNYKHRINSNMFMLEFKGTLKTCENLLLIYSEISNKTVKLLSLNNLCYLRFNGKFAEKLITYLCSDLNQDIQCIKGYNEFLKIKTDRRQVDNIVGKRFGKLIVLSYAGCKGKGLYKWNCVCDCGKETEVYGNSLKAGTTKSCGCLIIETLLKTAITHNMSRSITYSSWKAAKLRCTNPNNKKYSYYGGRGITMCNEWLNSFETFYNDMGERPSNLYSLERIDNELGYSKENCKWATKKEQQNNTRHNHWIEFNGEKRTITDIANEFNINSGTLCSRLKSGLSIEEAVNKPLRGK